MKKALAILLTAAMTLSLTACSGGSSGSSGSSSQAAQETTKAAVEIHSVSQGQEATSAEEKVIDENKKRELIVATDVEPDAFVPWNPDLGQGNDDNPILTNLYESAFQATYDGTFVPNLAESYEVNDDCTEWTIHFRDDVHFSNGDPLTMEDVVFSYDGNAHHKSNRTLWEFYDHTEIIDEHTVKIYCTAPKVTLMRGAFGNRCGVILNKKYFDEVGMEGYIAKPIGTGPYCVTDIKSHEYIVFEKNPNYWNKEVDPFYEKITLKFLSDQNTQMLALENREIDVLLNAKLPPLLRLPKDTHITWDIRQAAGPFTISFNEINAPTDNIYIRKAISCLVNRDAINDVVFDGYSQPNYIGGQKFYLGYPDESEVTCWPEEYDPEKAKEYLKQGGYNGEPIVLATQSGTMMDTIAQVIQGEMLNLGINAEIKALDRASLLDLGKQVNGYNLLFNNAAASAMDMSHTKSSYKDSLAKGTNPILILQNDELDDAYTLAESTSDEEVRKHAYAKAISIRTEEVRSINVIDNLVITAFYDDIKGVRGCPITYMTYFKDWY